MRVGIFSDIHGNCVALDAVLRQFRDRDVDAYVCLGDALQGGLQPRDVLQRLQDLGCPVIKGNADALLLGEKLAEPPTETQMRAREWSVGELGQDGLAAIRSFVPGHEMPLHGGATLLCFHASPRSYEEVLLPDTSSDDVAAAFAGTDAGVCAGGHTHLQWLRTFGERRYFNPGTVGMAVNKQSHPDRPEFYPFAQYAVIHCYDGNVGVEFSQAPFNVDAFHHVARASSHPHAGELAARYSA